MATHVHRQRREPTQYVNLGWYDADFFMGFSKRGLLDRFAVIETSTWQRDLPRVMTQIRPTYGQRHMPGILVPIDQKESRCRTQATHVDPRVRSQPGPR